MTGTRGIPSVMGGVETHCEGLCPRLAALGTDITVVRRSAYVSDGLTEWEGVRLKDIKSPKVKALEAIVHTYRAVNYAARVHADIIHIHAIGPALMTPYAKLRGLRVVVTHHGPEYERDKWGGAARAMLRLGERLAVRYADDLIVISEVIRKLVRDKYGRTKRIYTIPNGVPACVRCDDEAYFRELGIEPGKYILGMCRFVPEKRLQDLVEAVRGLEGYRLVLAGDADFEDAYSRKLKSDARAAGAVLPGFVTGDRRRALLTHAACFVLPSSHEGLPIALLEAMSYGLKVVVSDIPANLETGLSPDSYFRCRDVEDLRRKLEARLSDKEEPDYDMSPYRWDSIAERVYRIYESQDI